MRVDVFVSCECRGLQRGSEHGAALSALDARHGAPRRARDDLRDRNQPAFGRVRRAGEHRRKRNSPKFFWEVVFWRLSTTNRVTRRWRSRTAVEYHVLVLCGFELPFSCLMFFHGGDACFRFRAVCLVVDNSAAFFGFLLAPFFSKSGRRRKWLAAAIAECTGRWMSRSRGYSLGCRMKLFAVAACVVTMMMMVMVTCCIGALKNVHADEPCSPPALTHIPIIDDAAHRHARSKVPVLPFRSLNSPPTHPNSCNSRVVHLLAEHGPVSQRACAPLCVFLPCFAVFFSLFSGDFPERVRTYRGGIDARWYDCRLPVSHSAQRVNPQAVAGEFLTYMQQFSHRFFVRQCSCCLWFE